MVFIHTSNLLDTVFQKWIILTQPQSSAGSIIHILGIHIWISLSGRCVIAPTRQQLIKCSCLYLHTTCETYTQPWHTQPDASIIIQWGFRCVQHLYHIQSVLHYYCRDRHDHIPLMRVLEILDDMRLCLPCTMKRGMASYGTPKLKYFLLKTLHYTA